MKDKIKNVLLFIKNILINKYVLISIAFIAFITTLVISIFTIRAKKLEAQVIISVDGNTIKNIEIFEQDEVYPELIIESGDELPSIKSYFIDEDFDIEGMKATYYLSNGRLADLKDYTYINDDEKTITMYVTNLYILLNNGKDEYASILKIKDSTPPDFVIEDLVITEGTKYTPFDFIKEYKDNSSSSSFFVYYQDEEQKSLTKVGEYDIALKVCDNYQNCKDVNAKLIINKKPTANPTNPSTPINPGTPGNYEETPTTPTQPTTPETPVAPGKDEEVKPKPITPPKPYVVRTEEKYNFNYKNEEKYGVKISYVGDVTAKYYSDGSVVYENARNVISSINADGFNGTYNSMLNEATNLQNSLKPTRDLFLSKTNATRAENGAAPVVIDSKLSTVATVRAMEIAFTATLQHVRPGGRMWDSILYEAGYKNFAAAENLAGYYLSDALAYNGLVGSSSHKSSIINKTYTKMGVGKYTFNGKTFWVQLFMK